MSGLASASNLRIAQRNEDIAGSYNQLFTCHVRVCAADNRRRFINKMILKSFHHFKTLSFESPPVPSNVNKKKRNYHWISESKWGGGEGERRKYFGTFGGWMDLQSGFLGIHSLKLEAFVWCVVKHFGCRVISIILSGPSLPSLFSKPRRMIVVSWFTQHHICMYSADVFSG